MTELVGVITRMVDKAYRLTRIANGIEPNFEDIIETLRDLSNYGVIGAMVQEGSWEAKNPVKLVYLAGPIDAVTTSEAAGWREQMARMLSYSRITSFNPHSAFMNGSINTAYLIRGINRTAIAACDVMVARLDQFAVSVGTQREIEYAKAIGKRVVAWVSSDRWKNMLELYDVELVYSAEAAANAVIGGDVYFDPNNAVQSAAEVLKSDKAEWINSIRPEPVEFQGIDRIIHDDTEPDENQEDTHNFRLNP